MYIYDLVTQQVFGVVVGDRMNLKINILTIERNANLDIFLCFTKKKNQKIKKKKTVLTTVAGKAIDIFGSLNGYIIFDTIDSI